MTDSTEHNQLALVIGGPHDGQYVTIDSRRPVWRLLNPLPGEIEGPLDLTQPVIAEFHHTDYRVRQFVAGGRDMFFLVEEGIDIYAAMVRLRQRYHER